MKKLVVAAVVLALCTVPIAEISAQPVTKAAVAEEAVEHPRLVKAITDLEDAIAYMEAAPHNFGGHKAAAIASCKKALIQLRRALAYRAKVEAK
jgi:hypothetical protein